MMPTNYQAWRQCITVDCGLALTSEFCAQRLAALNNPKEHHTQQLTKLYGPGHIAQLIAWFEQAKASG